MSRMVWNDLGERKFEAGIDRGVLYVDGEGVPWNGLISVEEATVGGEIQGFHIDGVRYLNHVTNEEFAATVTAFTYPDEFDACDGVSLVANGMYATNQQRKQFGMCYRTKVGDDIDGLESGYKLHLIYNAIAGSSSGPAYATFADSITATEFVWDIKTRPVRFEGFKPTAYLSFDSRDVPSDLLNDLEDILYGNGTDDPRLPSVPELLHMFQEYDPDMFDAGWLTETYYATIDAGDISETYTDTIDGGSP